MSLNVGKELSALEQMTVRELRARFAEVFGEATGAKNKTWLVRRIIWRMQSMVEGDISERARQRAAELANDADIRLSPPKPKPAAELPAKQSTTAKLVVAEDNRLPLPGSVVTREYKGRTYQVKILSKGFELEGEIHKSLSAVAKRITGQHCNGYHFFRLRKEQTQ